MKLLKPIAQEAAALDCAVGLYNHGNWFGEPENELAILEAMKLPNVGLVYNLHHGHDHLDRFPALLQKMLPHLYAINLNGMVRQGDQKGLKLLPLGSGDLDLTLLRTIQESGYRGPLGILGHTEDDVELRLRDNLEGLDWLVARLNGKDPGPRPKPRTYKAPPPSSLQTPPFSVELVAKIVAEARADGDARRGALVFRAATSACLSCHKVEGQGGTVGPDLSTIGKTSTPQEIVESVLWPRRQVKPEYVALQITTSDGRSLQGYKRQETDQQLTLVEPGTDKVQRIDKSTIEERREIGTLMPDNLDAALTPVQRRDLVRFLLELGHTPGLASAAAWPRRGHVPLRPGAAPARRLAALAGSGEPRSAVRFLREGSRPFPAPAVRPAPLLPEFPGLDGGKEGHWGNQNEATWADDRWNRTDLGSVICGVFRGAGVTVPKGVCVRLGDRGELAACFNPETLCYEALWQGGFLKLLLGPARLHGRPASWTATPCPAGRPKARTTVCLSRLLSSRQARCLLLSPRRRGNAGRPVGGEWPVHPPGRARPTSIRWRT